MPKKAKYKATPKTAISEDTSPIEESAIDTFLFLRSLEGEGEGKIEVQLLPAFIEQLAVEVEELKRLRDQILR